jgi:hypothetical protein
MQPINAQSAVRAHQEAATKPIHIKHPGALHKELHVPEGQHIPVKELHSKLASAKKSGNVKLEKRLVFAENFGHKK